MLIDLDDAGQISGSMIGSFMFAPSISGGLSAESSIAYDNLLSKNWNITLTKRDWTPAAITTTGWWDASDSSTVHEDDTAGFVSQLDDKSGTGNNLVQANSTLQPALGTFNGLGALDADGADDFMSASSLPVDSSGNIMVFAVT